MTGDFDRSDPEARAEAALRRSARRHTGLRWLAAFGLLAAAAAGPFFAEALTGAPGSVVGAVVASALCIGLAVVVWPWAWSEEELGQRRLEAIWAEARTDASAAVPWERYAAWAVADGEQVRLLQLVCAPCSDPGPRRLSLQVVQRIDAAAIAEAAEAMEQLRETCEQHELAAMRAHAHAELLADRRADDAALEAVDAAAAAADHAAEEQMRREMTAQDVAERRAQAAAVAKALRRP